MKIIDRIKAGARVAPAFLIILYYLFFALDIYTTYLASPDLKFEGNRFIRYFNLTWSQIILKDSLIFLLVTIGLLIALNYLHKYYQNNSIKEKHSFIVEVFHNKKLLISFIMLGCFYSHVINLGHIVINNYMSYIYLLRTESLLYNISTRYISNQPLFLFYIQIVPIIIGYVVAAYKVKKIRNKYRTMSM